MKLELRAWKSFKAVVTNFLGNIKVENQFHQYISFSSMKKR